MTPETPQRKWLIIALVYNHQYYDELYRAAFPNDTDGYISMEMQKNNLYNAIDDIPYSDDIKILLVENRFRFSGTAASPSLSNTLTVTEKVKGTGLRQPEHTDCGELQHSAPWDMQEAGEILTDDKPLAALLQKLVTHEPYKADRHILITYGHGSMLGINLVTSRKAMQTTTGAKPEKDATKQPNITEATPVGAATLFLKDMALEGAFFTARTDKMSLLFDGMKNKRLPDKPVFTAEEFKAFLQSADHHAVLTNSELGKAIRAAFPGRDNGEKPLDLLVMFNCLMQNLYTQYELKDSVDILVAPQTGICYPGYDWRSVFGALTTKPGMPNEELAVLFTAPFTANAGFSPHYQTYFPNFGEDIDAWKIVSVKLEAGKLEAVKTAFTTFISQLTDACSRNSRVVNHVSVALAQCFNFTLDCIGNAERMIDLHCFCAEFIKVASEGNPLMQSLVQPALALQQSLEKIKSCGSFTGKNVFRGKYFYIDTEDKESQTRSAGFLLQKQRYPDHTAINDMLSDSNSEFAPAFLANTGFFDFYKNYAPAAEKEITG